MPRLGRTRAGAIVVLALLAAIFVLRLFIDEPGPLFLIPILLAGLWFGPWWGVAAGLACTGLYGLEREFNPPMDDAGLVPTTVGRLVIYCAAGGIVGQLSKERGELGRRVSEQREELVELRTVQDALTPSSPPERPSLELATCYLPAEHGVAGDFYVVAPGSRGSTLVAVGDVAGRGLDAAKRAWYVRTLIASSAEFAEDPSAILDRANAALMEEAGPSETFVTAACVIFRPDEMAAHWAVAGHDPPVSLDRGEPLGELETAGLPIGLEPSLGCRTTTTSLSPGEGLLVYTDGVTEARPTGRANGFALFGERRLRQTLSELAGRSSEDVVDGIRKAVKSFSGGELADDLCMLAMRVNPQPDTTEVC